MRLSGSSSLMTFRVCDGENKSPGRGSPAGEIRKSKDPHDPNGIRIWRTACPTNAESTYYTGRWGRHSAQCHLVFPRFANPAQIVGRTPWSARVPWTRFSPTESASSAQGKPTRASAADQGVRPTINADCPILTKPRDIGHSACHDVFPHPVRLEHERCDPCGYARQPLGPVEPVSGCRVSSARD